jgi:Tfp pilus assembly protein PilO
MEVRGDFPGIYRFLVDLERLPRIVRVQSLELERHMAKGRNDEERPQGDLDVAVTVVVYCEGQGGDA